MKTEILVLGAGISGLSVAAELKKLGHEVMVLESSDRPGGRIRSEKVDGTLLEAGPNTLMLRRASTEEFLQRHGIWPSREIPDPAAKTRFLERGRGLEPLTPGHLFQNILKPLGFLRFLSGGIGFGTASENQTLKEFVLRRFGARAYKFLAEPFVSGIYAGDASELILSQAFPRLHRADHAPSLWLGLRAQGKEKSSSQKALLSFKDGLETIPRILSADLGDSLHYEVETSAIQDLGQDGFRLMTSLGEIQCRHLVLGIPGKALASVLPESMQAHLFDSIRMPRVCVHHFRVFEDQIQEKRRGFGFLMVEPRRRNLLGCLMPSAMFPARTQDGSVLFTAFLGGVSQSELAQQPLEVQRDLVFAQIRRTMRIDGQYQFWKSYAWDRAIEQYDLNQLRIHRHVEELETRFRGLHFCHALVRGVALPDRIDAAIQTARKIHGAG